MRFKLFVFTFIITTLGALPSLSQESSRPIFASSIYNGTPASGYGYLYVPLSTPLGNRACYFDNNSTVASSVTTATELSYLSGVTSPIQAQINAISGSSSRMTNTITTSITIPTLVKDYLLNVDTSMGVLTETLPDAVASNGWCVDIKNIGNPASAITVITQNGQTIDRASTDALTGQYDAIRYCAMASNWWKH